MATYGYIRVSTKDQNPQRQIDKMTLLGVSDLFVDKASGKNLDRPAYKSLLDKVKEGDTILFDSLDRLGRSYDDVTREWRRLTREVGCELKVLDLEFFDSQAFKMMGDVGTCVEDMLLSLLAYVAQTEREKNRVRQAEGIAIAKKQGRYKGKPKTTYSEEQIRRAKDALSVSKAAAAKVLGCHPNTIYNMIEDGRL